MGSFKMKRIFAISLLVNAVIFFSACTNREVTHSITINIDQNWEFSEKDSKLWMPAQVPGTVHADLLNNEQIPDPYYRFNEDSIQWIENSDWVYRTTFNINPDLLLYNVVELHFAGLDTYASVFVNDTLILETDNMFIDWTVDVKKSLQVGNNELKVIFHSAVDKGLEKLQKLDYYLPAANEQAPVDKRTNVFTRKAPFHYGWDWGPRMVTAGIWRKVSLRAHDYAIIENIHVQTLDITTKQAKLKANANIRVFEAGDYKLSLNINNRIQKINQKIHLDSGLQTINFNFEIDDPRLWWTNGLGEAYLYDFSWSLSRNKQILSRNEFSYGIRSLKIIQKPDSVGNTFYVELNGQPVFMKGANVIPSETTTPSVSDERYIQLIKSAVNANMNMLRVWGGAIYEDEIFYELCDRHGILIWQDFMFACALQPGDENHLKNIENEANYNVKRLQNHPCIALWCGNNENFHAWHHWGWKDMYPDKIRDFVYNTYDTIFNSILPAAVAKYDSGTYYHPSSPTAFNNMLADRKSGDEHDWTIWFGQRPFSDFALNVPRFVSEYGLQSFPQMSTINKFTLPDDREFNSPVMRHRQRSNMGWIESGFNGNDMIKWYMQMYYKVPDSFDDFVYVSQLLQAKAYKTAIEAHRRNMPHCMGSLYWQINDSWPTVSWSTIDFYGNWKAAHYAAKNAFEPVLVSPVLNDNVVEIFAVSDKLTDIDAKLNVKLADMNGKLLFDITKNRSIEANNSSIIYMFSTDTLDLKAEDCFLHVSLSENQKILSHNTMLFKKPMHVNFQKANINIEKWSKVSDGYELVLNSDVFAKGVYVQTPDIEEVFVVDNYFDILPADQVKVVLHTSKQLNIPNDIRIDCLNNIYFGNQN